MNIENALEFINLSKQLSECEVENQSLQMNLKHLETRLIKEQDNHSEIINEIDKTKKEITSVLKTHNRLKDKIDSNGKIILSFFKEYPQLNNMIYISKNDETKYKIYLDEDNLKYILSL